MVDSFRISPVIQKTSTSSSDSNNDNRNNERDNNDNQKNWRDDPDCWYYDTYVCDKDGKCDSENFDCVTDCDDGSSVTTGEPCPGEEQGDETGDNDKKEGEDEKRPTSDNPYCDVVRQTGEPYESCFDRKDYSETTGLYPCRDGSDVEDWRDCPDGPEANSNSNDDEDEEETANCGGEPCTPTEKEDSWVDEPEYFENNDGALGDPITDEEEIEEIEETAAEEEEFAVEDEEDTEEEDTDEEDAFYG